MSYDWDPSDLSESDEDAIRDLLLFHSVSVVDIFDGNLRRKVDCDE